MLVFLISQDKSCAPSSRCPHSCTMGNRPKIPWIPSPAAAMQGACVVGISKCPPSAHFMPPPHAPNLLLQDQVARALASIKDVLEKLAKTIGEQGAVAMVSERRARCPPSSLYLTVQHCATMPTVGIGTPPPLPVPAATSVCCVLNAPPRPSLSPAGQGPRHGAEPASHAGWGHPGADDREPAASPRQAG